MAYRSGFPFGPVGGSGMFDLRREIDRLFDDAFGGQQGQPQAQQAQQAQQGGRSAARQFTPAADAREGEREITLRLDLPGVRPEDVDISVENGLLTVRGQRHQERKEGQEGRYHFVERSYGAFARAFHLPQNVDESQIRADFEHGELIIHVPKPALPQPRKVQIGVGGQTAVSGGQASTPAATSPGVPAQGAPDQGASDM